MKSHATSMCDVCCCFGFVTLGAEKEREIFDLELELEFGGDLIWRDKEEWGVTWGTCRGSRATTCNATTRGNTWSHDCIRACHIVSAYPDTHFSTIIGYSLSLSLTFFLLSGIPCLKPWKLMFPTFHAQQLHPAIHAPHCVLIWSQFLFFNESMCGFCISSFSIAG